MVTWGYRVAKTYVHKSHDPENHAAAHELAVQPTSRSLFLIQEWFSIAMLRLNAAPGRQDRAESRSCPTFICFEISAAHLVPEGSPVCVLTSFGPILSRERRDANDRINLVRLRT